MQELKNSLQIGKKELFLILLILVVGLLLRFYQVEKRTSFEADQEDIAIKALELLHGDPVLLGPVTSVGKFSGGPAFIYLWALFSFFLSQDPAAGVYLSSVIGVLMAFILYLVGRLLFDAKTALFLTLLYAISFTAIVWDLSPWGPSLFYIAETIFLAGAILFLKNPLGLLLVVLGFALGFHSHIAIFISLVPISLFWLIFKPKLKDRRVGFYSLGIILLAVLPNFLFDVTHNFDNLKRFFSLFGTGVSAGGATGLKVFYTLYNTTSALLLPYLDKKYAFIIFLFVVVIAVRGVYKDRKLRKPLVLLLLSIFIPFFLFLTWQGNFSEYYLMGAIPSFILLVGYLFFTYFKRYKIIFLVGLILFLFYNLKAWYVYKRPLNLSAKKKAVEFIVNKAGVEGYGVSLTTSPGLHFGYPYIFSYYGAKPDLPPLKNQKKIFTIVVPPGFEGVQAMVEFDGVGVRWEGVD